MKRKRRQIAWVQQSGVRDASSCAPMPEWPPSLLVFAGSVEVEVGGKTTVKMEEMAISVA